MAERGIIVDHSTLHRWVIRLVPLPDKTFRRHKPPTRRRWRMDETYIRVSGLGQFGRDLKKCMELKRVYLQREFPLLDDNYNPCSRVNYPKEVIPENMSLLSAS